MNEECPPKEQVEEGAPLWVITFGDLMSLLMCFFVLLLSFSEMDRKKYKMVSGSMAQAFGIQREKPVFESPKGQKLIAKDFDQAAIITKIKEAIKPFVNELENQYQELNDSVELEIGEDKVTIRMMGETTFDSGKAELHPAFGPLLKRIGAVLSQTKGEIIIAGHTDNVPLRGGLYGSNLGLSMARAGSVAEFMLRTTSIDPKRLSTMGFGEYRPLTTNDTVQGRRKNRRVEIIVSH